MTGFRVVDHTKSKSGDRILVLNSEVQNLFHKIKVYNLDQGIPISDENFIFQRILKDGTISFCNTRSFEPRIKKYCRQAGMSELKSQHDVRRTVITNLYDAEVPLKEIQRIAGHSSLKQTLDCIKFRDHGNDNSGLTRESAAEQLEFISSDRIEKIENEKSYPHPDEILAMADCYKNPSLCNYYCSHECPIGKEYVPEVTVKDLSMITLDY